MLNSTDDLPVADSSRGREDDFTCSFKVEEAAIAAAAAEKSILSQFWLLLLALPMFCATTNMVAIGI